MYLDDQAALDEIAGTQSVERDVVEHLLSETQAQAGSDSFYVFWFDKGGGAGGGTRRSRTLLAFATPDTALAFAQQNELVGPDTRPRLRRLSLARLLLVVLRETNIVALRLVRDETPSSAGQLPDGLHITRVALLARLHPQ